jgi:hypothetical protein
VTHRKNGVVALFCVVITTPLIGHMTGQRATSDPQKTMAALRVGFYTEWSIFTVFCGLRIAWKITIEKVEFTPYVLLILRILES